MRRRRRPEKGAEFDLGLGLGGLFKGLGRIIELVSKMAEEGQVEVTRTGEIKGLGEGAKGVYGFTIRTGLGGTPEVSQFGNIRPTPKGPVVEEVREPIVDVFDEADRLLVIAELPGVEEGNIRLEVKGDILVISAEDRDRKYAKEVLLPGPIDESGMQSSYKNGVLEITLPKTKGDG